MDNFQITQILDSMSILIDSREQPTEKATRRFNSFGCDYSRATLDFGDYTFNFVCNNVAHFNINHRIVPEVMIERKYSVDEIAQNFTRERDRFRREFERMKEHKAKAYILIENATWENIMNGKYRSKVNPNALIASMLAFQSRYDINYVFCKSETSGKLIHEILYRELKERLERGDYG